MLEFIFWAWIAWIVLNTTMFLCGVVFVKPLHPQYNGFKIFVPDSYVSMLTRDELTAVVMHELGHKANAHVMKNFVRIMFFMMMTARRRAKQELQADDYVSAKYRLALASALRKMSTHPFDLQRAERLEAFAAPYARDARVRPPMGEV